jgi:DNA-binding LacI/PurR family transcriptional regulator
MASRYKAPDDVAVVGFDDGSQLGVWSRYEMVRIDIERQWVFFPGIAYGFEGCSPS